MREHDFAYNGTVIVLGDNIVGYDSDRVCKASSTLRMSFGACIVLIRVHKADGCIWCAVPNDARAIRWLCLYSR